MPNAQLNLFSNVQMTNSSTALWKKARVVPQNQVSTDWRKDKDSHDYKGGLE